MKYHPFLLLNGDIDWIAVSFVSILLMMVMAVLISLWIERRALMKIHYAASGNTICGRFIAGWTSGRIIQHTMNVENVTCKQCLRKLVEQGLINEKGMAEATTSTSSRLSESHD